MKAEWERRACPLCESVRQSEHRSGQTGRLHLRFPEIARIREPFSSVAPCISKAGGTLRIVGRGDSAAVDRKTLSKYPAHSVDDRSELHPIAAAREFGLPARYLTLI
jgi:hypothetical protein